MVSAFQWSITLPGLCGGQSPLFRDPPRRLSPLRGLQSCVLAVSGGSGSQLQSEGVMLPWRYMREALLQRRLGGDD